VERAEVAKTLGPRSPAELREGTDLHGLDEDPVRAVSETLRPKDVSSFPIAARSGPSTRAATLQPPPSPSDGIIVIYYTKC